MLYLAIPSHNEAATIGVLLWRLRSVLAEFPREYEVVVYDDASNDETSEVLEPYTKVLPLTVLRGERTVGYAGAIDALVRYVSRQTRYPRRDAMLLLQGDFTDPPALVPEFAKRFEGGADMVIGERSRSSDTPVSVRRLLRVTPWVTRPFVRVEGVRDITSSFRLVRISVLRDLIRAAGDAPVCIGDELTANADFLLRTVPLARRVETLAVEPTFGVRTRETRRITMRDGLALARWAWSARGRRVAPSTAPESPENPGRSQRSESRADSRSDARPDSKNETRSDSKAEPRTEVRVETRSEPRLDIRASARGESRPNPRNEARREARRDARNEARNDPRKRERFEPREEEIRDYGNDGIYNPNPEPRPAPANDDRVETVADDSNGAAPVEERRTKRPRPKRRKRGQRGERTAANINEDDSSDDSDNETSTQTTAPRETNVSESPEAAERDADEISSGDAVEGDRVKRARKKRRKRGSKRKRNPDGTLVEAAEGAPSVVDNESSGSHDAGRDDDDSDGNDSDGSERDDNESGEPALNADGTPAPRARRRGRRGRRGGARRNRSNAGEASSESTSESSNGAAPHSDAHSDNAPQRSFDSGTDNAST